jgi:hypothetical protein
MSALKGGHAAAELVARRLRTGLITRRIRSQMRNRLRQGGPAETALDALARLFDE